MFRLLLVDTHAPRRALLGGALLGAVGFEILKLVANTLLAHTRGQPAFQAFGVALILLIWINYFSRLVMYAAAWAYTSPLALEQRTTEAMRAPGAALSTDNGEAPGPAAPPPSRRVILRSRPPSRSPSSVPGCSPPAPPWSPGSPSDPWRPLPLTRRILRAADR